MTERIRSAIKVTGLSIAAIIAIGPPLGHAVDEVQESREHIRLEAERSAAELAEYAYRTGPLWAYTHLRVQEILAHRSLEESEEARQRVLDAAGKPIFAEERVLDWPVRAARAPIEVRGATVGWVEVEESDRPFLEELARLALLSGMLGIAAFFGFVRLPLRVLDRTFGRLELRNKELQQREAELRSQNRISDAALNNMSQGLCMFDAERRLVICNKRYVELYRLPPELSKPGTPLSDILEHRVQTGIYGANAEQRVQERLDRAAASGQHTETVEQDDGRAIEILHDPLPNGGWVATHEDITARRRSEARIAYLASHDPLTDLPNRVLFRETLEAALAGMARGASLAVHCIDLDRFKDVNDTLGHPFGDALLRQVADRLRATAREDTMVARLGGDEFALIQKNLDRPEDASALAERIIQVIGKPYDVEEQELVVTASVGISLAPGDDADPDQLLKNTDLALYRAKEEGRATFHFFEREMDDRLQARRLFEKELRAALGNGELEVYYQPLLDIEAHAICGFEALLRWHHPARGMVSPAAFIPLAEDTGLIVPIGEWVLRTACREAISWPPHIKVAVNLSPVQFKSRNLVSMAVGALAAAGLAPERLELEITESVLLQESETTLATLHSLRDIGIRISLDDFGTGYSSLSYLRSFPFDKIKIDQSFIRELSTKKDSGAIVHAIMDLARNLGMGTTAEGVETEEHLNLLRGEGCTEIQGYLISAARPAAEIPELMARYGGRRIEQGTVEQHPTVKTWAA